MVNRDFRKCPKIAKCYYLNAENKFIVDWEYKKLQLSALLQTKRLDFSGRIQEKPFILVLFIINKLHNFDLPCLFCLGLFYIIYKVPSPLNKRTRALYRCKNYKMEIMIHRNMRKFSFNLNVI